MVVSLRGRHLPPIAPQFASPRQVVPSFAGSVLVHHEIQFSLRGSILLPASGECFHFYVVGVGGLGDSQRCSAGYHLDHLCDTWIHSSMSTHAHEVWYGALETFQRITLLRRFALRTIPHRVYLPDSIVGCGSDPFNSPSPPPCLARRNPSADLFYPTIATHFPASQGPFAWRKRL